MRPLFLTNPRSTWVQSPRTYQSPAEYANPIHFAGEQSSYPRLWWSLVIFCGVAGLVIVWFTK